nr:hypothetical protein [Candidatus Sigynarchaeota archaeon]
MSEQTCQLDDAFATAFGFLDPAVPANKTNLKSLTRDQVEVKTTVSVEVKVLGLFCNLECSIDKVVENVSGVLSSVHDLKLIKTWKDKIAKWIKDTHEKYKTAVGKAISAGMDSIEVGYTNDNIPLLTAVLEFTVSFKSSKP